ncbi:MAG: type III-D CRISPR-associated protein Csx19 [Ardenticatenaceae bacterium]
MNTVPTITPITVDDSFNDDPASWLVKQAQEHGLRYLLAHADDGVIWGRVDDDKLLTSHDVMPKYSPKLCSITLQQCRLFSQRGELLLWNDEGQWCARLVTDHNISEEDYFEEKQILWGDKVDRVDKKTTFSFMREGAQGMRHAVPIYVLKEEAQNRRLRLIVRHFITYNNDGEASIRTSRLVDFHL